MTQPAALHDLLTAVAQGQISPDSALTKLKHLDYQPIDDFAKVDHHRTLRTGFPEVIWGHDKTVQQLVKNFQATQAALDLTQQQIYQLAKNSFEAAFISSAHKQTLIAELDQVVKQFTH